MQILRIATRKSQLALWQANFIAHKLKTFYPTLQIILLPMITSGDRLTHNNIQHATLPGKNLFVKELEDALLLNKADIAVHSMKDVPIHLPAELTLPVIMQRANPFDALITPEHQTLDQLASGAIIGTTSLRRQAQLLAYRPDLNIKPLRGNIDTRLKQLATGDFNGIVLAVAGLKRLNKQDKISEIMNEKLMLPACGQGALGIECRKDDIAVQTIIQVLNHPVSALCVQVERYVNNLLGGSCQMPVAVYCCQESDDKLQLQARILSADGKSLIETKHCATNDIAFDMAQQCVATLFAQGAAELLDNYKAYNRNI